MTIYTVPIGAIVFATGSMQWNWGLESCRKLGDYAGKKKIDIALELEPFRLSLLNSVDAMVRFVDDCAALLEKAAEPGIALTLQRQSAHFVEPSDRSYAERLSEVIDQLIPSASAAVRGMRS